jgi:rRNA-processing protein FCF1|tara:strand:- start:158 stop:613 length:456 start_codon:yes stop_codon:yes gene_type:complete
MKRSTIKRKSYERKREMIAIEDTNHILTIIEHNGACMRTRAQIKNNISRILIPKFVIKEVQKIKDLTEFEIVQTVSSLLKKKVSLIKCNSDVKIAATQLELKYPKTHFPDSLLLALAEFGTYGILTYDHGILNCAKSEGILTITPKWNGCQ